MNRQPELLEVVGALGAPGRLPGRLDGRKKQGNQNRDNGDNDEKLDQGETPSESDVNHSCGKTPLTMAVEKKADKN